MGVFQDPFSNTTYLAELLGAEVESGSLINTNLDEGTCLTFSGSSQYVEVADTDNLTFGNGTSDSAFSMTAWIYMVDATNFYICSKDDFGGAANQREYRWIVNASDLLDISLVDNSAAASIGRTYSTALTTLQNQWVHVAFTYSGSSTAAGLKLYVNGIRVDTTSVTGGVYVAMENKTRAFQIGGRSSSSNYANGKIDDFRVFASELTSLEIFQVYSTGINPSSPQNWWKFNDGSGTTATDSGSGGNNGDLTGHAPTWTTTHVPFYTRRTRTNSTDLMSGLSSSGVSSLAYTIAKKPGNFIGKLQFSSDNSTWKNANGDLVSNVGGYSFDGVDDTMFNTTANFRSSDSAGTISAWIFINPQSSFGIAKTIFGSADTASVTRFLSFEVNSNGKLAIRQNDNGTTDNIVGHTTLQPGHWHHVAVVSTGTAYILYVDGVAETLTVSSGSNTGDWFADTSARDNFTIGLLRTSSDSQLLAGILDDIRLYDVALSASDIVALFSRHKDNNSANRQGWWKLDADGTDSSSNGYNMSIVGAAPISDWWMVPPFGEPTIEDYDTIKFDGVNDSASKTISNYRSSDSAGSIAVWVFIEGDPTGTVNHIFSSSDTGTDTHFFNFNAIESGTSNTDQFRISTRNNAGTNNIVLTSKAFPRFQWHHVVLTSSGTAWKIYVNGIEQTLTVTGSNTGDWFADITTLTRDNIAVGAYLGLTPSHYFNGRIANLAVYSSELSASTVLTDFLNGYPSSTDCVSLWKMNEGTGDLSDSVGSDTLTVSGATWISDLWRPQPGTPAQQTIDLTSLSLTSALYVRTLYSSLLSDRGMALNEITVNYTVSYSETGSGGIVCGGSGDISLANIISGTGGVLCGGSGTISLANIISGSGGIVCGGDGTTSLANIIIGSGGVVCGGDATFGVLYNITGTGGIVIGGVGIDTYTPGEEEEEIFATYLAGNLNIRTLLDKRLKIVRTFTKSLNINREVGP